MSRLGFDISGESAWTPTSMSLSTIPNSRRKVFKGRKTNRTDDIAGATTSFRSTAQNSTSRRPKLHSTLDIEGAQPKRLHQSKNKPDFFNVSDIDGAQCRHHFTSSRHVNPLDPKYELPTAPEIQPSVPRFLRDGMDYSDVEGTTTKEKYPWKTRDSYNVGDIEGTQSSWKPRRFREMSKGDKINSLDVSDIVGGEFESSRQVNPLDPEYNIYGEQIAASPMSRPRPLKKETNTPFFALKTDDVPGAVPNHKYFKHLREQDRRAPKSDLNSVRDIPGANPDTLKRGLVTARKTNPLQPNYKNLDGQRVLDSWKREARKKEPPDAVHFKDSRKYRIETLERELAATTAELKHLKSSYKSPAAKAADVQAVADLPENPASE